MSHEAWQDRFIDVLLDEELGGDKAPDVLAAVRLALQRGPRRQFRTSRWLALAASLTVLAGGGMWLMRPPPKGAIEATGEFRVLGGGVPRRGSTVSTSDGSAKFQVGGYVRVEAEPETELRFQGGPKREALFLKMGEIECSVEPDHGTMVVETELGKVSVIGTHFGVAVREEPTEKEMAAMKKQMVVSVMSGAVLVTGLWGEHTVRAGEQLRADADSVVKSNAGPSRQATPAATANAGMEEMARDAQSVFMAAKLLKKQGRHEEARAKYLEASAEFLKAYEADPTGELGGSAGIQAAQCCIRAEDWPGATALLTVIVDAEGMPAGIKSEAMYWCGHAYATWSQAEGGDKPLFAKAEKVWGQLCRITCIDSTVRYPSPTAGSS